MWKKANQMVAGLHVTLLVMGFGWEIYYSNIHKVHQTNRESVSVYCLAPRRPVWITIVWHNKILCAVIWSTRSWQHIHTLSHFYHHHRRHRHPPRLFLCGQYCHDHHFSDHTAHQCSLLTPEQSECRNVWVYVLTAESMRWVHVEYVHLCL